MTETADADVQRAVGEVLVRYATGIDTRDWDLFRTCFTDDCEADYGDIGVWHGAGEITEWMRDSHAPAGLTMHRITNQVVTQHGDGVRARSYVDAIVMGSDNVHGSRACGYYDDELVLTGGTWKIARRRFTMVLLQTANSDFALP
jgi:3-phenylpropionate/cinnamic acid dioxygenase small subunit